LIRRIRSRDNPLFKSLYRLATSSRARREEARTLLDGAHLIAAYRASGGTAEILAASESGYTRGEVRHLLDEAPARARILFSDTLFDAIAQVATPTGILAVICTPRARPLPEELGSCLLLEGIQDPGNLGSLLRSAVAAGLRQVFLAKGCVFVWSPKVLRAGQGAHFFLDLHEGVPLAAIAERFPGTVVATDPHAEASLFDADLSGRIAWIFGAEGRGISPALAACAGLKLRIPIAAPAESLNVAAAAAICLFEQVRQAKGAFTRRTVQER
jgi:RNA methyltransferase, TrmH family